ncbi:MAG: hypothetical protein A2X56_12990 [Nitrospirae bacterium GWC2_57_13]|nr:MAG: hypothetical protein A2X56_12990 [Nitrospirae bacterium GWC2_57_13]
MNRDNVRGVTLIEMLVTLSILAILAGLAGPGMDLVRNEQVAGVAKELVADIQRQRLDAMTGNSGKGFGIRFEASGTYVRFRFDDCNDDYTYDADGCEGREEEGEAVKTVLPGTILLKKSDGSDFRNDVLIFDRRGTPRRNTWGFGNMTIIVNHASGMGVSKCIAVSMYRIRSGIWKWNDRSGRYDCFKD